MWSAALGLASGPAQTECLRPYPIVFTEALHTFFALLGRPKNGYPIANFGSASPKKRGKNYRGTTLLDMISKATARLVSNGFSDSRYAHNQEGFRQIVDVLTKYSSFIEILANR